MRPYANMPVVFQPIDSGWNSCLRDDGRDVAFLQCGFERDVAFSDILHFKTFQLQIQQYGMPCPVARNPRLAGCR